MKVALLLTILAGCAFTASVFYSHDLEDVAEDLAENIGEFLEDSAVLLLTGQQWEVERTVEEVRDTAEQLSEILENAVDGYYN